MTYYRAVVAAVSLSLALAQAAYWVRRAAQSRWRWRDMIRLLRDRLKGLFPTDGANMESDGDKTRDGEKIRRRIAREEAKQRQKNMQHVSIACSNVACAVLLTKVVSPNVNQSPVQDVCLAVFTITALIESCLPNKIHARSLGVCYSVVMLCICVWAGFGSSTEMDILYSNAMLIIPRLLFSLAYSQIFLVAFWNSVCMVLALTAYVRALPSPGHWHDSRFLLTELANVVLVMLGTAVTKKLVNAKARHVIQGRALDRQSSAMMELLQLVCDVVLELDSNLRFTEHVPKFAAMLTLNPMRCIKGLLLKDFIPSSDDRDIFETHLAEGLSKNSQNSTGSRPQALHTTFRDSMGNNIRVEVFYVTFEDLDLTHRAFVGVREFTDQPIADLKLFEKRRSSRGRRSQPHNRGTQPAIVPTPLAPGGGGGAAAGSAATAAAAPAAGVFGGAGVGGGTPSHRDDSEGSQTTSLTPSHSSLHRGRKELMLPRGLPTNDTARDIMLVQTLSKWNLLHSPLDCCPFHSAVKELQKRTVNLKEMLCFPTFQPEGNAQCQTCGALAKIKFDADKSESDEDEGQYCTVCHSEDVHRLYESDSAPATETSPRPDPVIVGL